jgi:hypothetical protein
MRLESIKTAKLRWLTLPALLFFVSSCSLFLSPEKPRDNPFDPNNPTPGVMEMNAFGYSANSVKVKWQTSMDGDENYPNVTIIRNSVQEPTSINDGTLVYNGPTTIADGDSYASFIDDAADSETDYYYAIWSYSDQDGTITYNGPVTDKATTRFYEVEIPPVEDGVLEYSGAAFFFTMPNTFSVTYDPGMDEFFYLIWFDFTAAPDFVDSIANAELVLTHELSPMGTTMDISVTQIMEDWDPSSAQMSPTDFYNQVTANSFTTFSDQTSGSTIQIVGDDTFSYPSYYWPVADIITNWLIHGDSNNGIIMRCPAVNSNYYNFYGLSAMDPSYRPRLKVQYYGDEPPEMP